MQRFFIIATNCAFLAVLLVGLPAATDMQLGDWQIASASTARNLLFCGLAIGAAGNLLAGWMVMKGRKMKILCWEWATVFVGILLVYWGFTHGYLNFDWLKQTLLWLQNHF